MTRSVLIDGIHHEITSSGYDDQVWRTACAVYSWCGREGRRRFIGGISEYGYQPYEGTWAGPEEGSDEHVDCVMCLAHEGA